MGLNIYCSMYVLHHLGLISSNILSNDVIDFQTKEEYLEQEPIYQHIYASTRRGKTMFLPDMPHYSCKQINGKHFTKVQYNGYDSPWRMVKECYDTCINLESGATISFNSTSDEPFRSYYGNPYNICLFG